MKKYLISIFIAAVIIVYVVYQYLGGSKSPSAVSTNTESAAIPSETTTSTTTSSDTSSQFKDGQYTGSVADAFYGNLQVQATISGGKIIDVAFLQYPNDNHESSQISSTAMPILKSEAISAQSASVDSVSGATQTSEAFKQSLGSALVQAKA